MVFLRGEENKVESNGECGKALARFVLMVATVRQPTRGLDLVLSLRRVECDVAAAS